jgi:hypothetical protein
VARGVNRRERRKPRGGGAARGGQQTEQEGTEETERRMCDDRYGPIHKAQLLSYMKLLDVPVGLVLNFHEKKLTDGIARLILPGANVA